MKKIFLSLMAVISAVTLMAQELPTACEAQLYFKYCFTTYGQASKNVFIDLLEGDGYNWNGANFKKSEIVDGKIVKTNVTYPQGNVRGCDSIFTNLTVNVKYAPEGVAGGDNGKPFSVSATKKVYFAQGNLQFRATADGSGTDLSRVCLDTVKKGIFRFAEHQYDRVGYTYNKGSYNVAGNVYYKDENNQDVLCNNTNSAEDYLGWWDAFNWGMSGYNNQPGVAADPWMYSCAFYSTKYAKGIALVQRNIDGTGFDWGVYNPIIINDSTTSPYGTWRTLSAAEWRYVLYDRDPTGNKLAKATIQTGSLDIQGLILFPDDWTGAPTEITVNYSTTKSVSGTSPSFSLTTNNPSWTANTYTLEQWQTLEKLGAVFLPAGGQRKNSVTSITAYYWTSTDYYTTNDASPMCILVQTTSSGAIQTYSIPNLSDRENGYSVRLVRDK